MSEHSQNELSKAVVLILGLKKENADLQLEIGGFHDTYTELEMKNRALIEALKVYHDADARNLTHDYPHGTADKALKKTGNL